MPKAKAKANREGQGCQSIKLPSSRRRQRQDKGVAEIKRGVTNVTGV